MELLFKTSDELRKYAHINGDLNFISAIQTIYLVEHNILIPVIGLRLYESIYTEYSAATQQAPMAEINEALLDRCRRVIGPFFVYYHADKADVAFSDSGMRRNESGNSKVAYQEQREKFKEANLREGELNIEALYQFLEENISAFPEWEESDEYSDFKSFFIRSGNEFKKYFTCETPLRLYRAIRPKMFDVEELTIRSALGDELYEGLKTKLKTADPDLTDKEKTLLQYLNKAVANLSVSHSIPLLNVKVSAAGISVIAAQAFSTNDRDNTRAQANDAALSLIMKSTVETGQSWIQKAMEYIKANPTAFDNWIGFTQKKTAPCGHNTQNVFGLV